MTLANDTILASLDFPAVIARIAEQATCAPGKAAVQRLRPLSSRDAVIRELALVDDTIAFLQAGGTVSFGGVIDVLDALTRAAMGAALSGEELRAIADAESALARVLAAVRANVGAGRPLQLLCRSCAETRELLRTIDRAVDRDGMIKDEASAELGKVRRQRQELRDEVRERCAAIVRNPAMAKLLSEPVVTVRAGRYVVCVRKEFVPQFAGVVHDESASGSTAYVEPMATVEANNRIRALEAAEAREVARILAALSADVAAHEAELRTNAGVLAQLDSLGARARWALKVRAGIPDLSDDRTVRIVQGRHPLLRREPVPLDVTIGEDFDILIISGPNMGGKSVALKTIGLFTLLACAGIPVPANAGTHFGWFDSVACVLGDEQSIAADLSSFSAHLQALKAAMAGAGDRSLILVDEIGGGTEPAAGAAVAQAFLEDLLQRRSRVVVTTHFTQLKTFAAETERVRNASMLFNPATNEPTYVLAVGVPGQSLALRLATALGLDAKVIERAKTLIGRQQRDLEQAFEGLARQRDALEHERAELRGEIARSREAETRLRSELERMDRERADFDRRAAAALDKAVADVRETLLAEARRRGETARRQVRALPQAEDVLAKTLIEMRRSLGLERPEPGEAPASDLVAGDAVLVRSFGAKGTIDQVYDRDVLVTIGNVKTVVPKTDVERTGRAAWERSTFVDRRFADRGALGASEGAEPGASTVDVRGMRVDEAVPVVDKALDAASLAGLTELRIIHGKGTGQLGRGLSEFLRDHAQVQSTRRAPDREGGSGVTVVTLK